MNQTLLLATDFLSSDTLGASAQLGALLLFAKANTIWRSEGMRKYPFAHLFVRVAFVLMVLLLIGLLFDKPIGQSGLNIIHIQTILLGALGGIGLILFARGLASLPSKLVFFGGTVQLLVGVLVGHFLLGENFGINRQLILLFLLIGQSLLVYQDRSSWLSLPNNKRIVPFLIGIIWGVYYPIVGVVQSEIGIWQTLIFSELGVFLTITIALIVRLKSELAGLKIKRHYLDMGQQSALSLSAQYLSILCLNLGGVIFQSILSSFSNLLYLYVFNKTFKEKLDLRYLLYFGGYGVLVLLL